MTVETNRLDCFACHISSQQSIAPHLTHYCIVRSDISPGLQAANLIHAAGESSPGNLSRGTFAVALVAPDEASLRAVYRRLMGAGVECVEIVETDGDYAGQLMAVGVRPGIREGLRPHLSSLPLLRGGKTK